MKTVMKMNGVVYADILIIVNTYINYALLRLTGIICKSPPQRLRLCLTAFVSSFYSFIMFADFIAPFVLALSKLAVATLMVLGAFRLRGKKDFLRLFGVFFAINFAFAGLMLALDIFLSPKNMVYKSGVVYCNISTLSLCVFTLVCFVVIRLISKIAAFKAPPQTMYDMTFELFENKFCAKAFCDTGNSVKEPFSLLPVVIAYEELCCGEEKSVTLKTLAMQNEDKARLVACTTVSGTKVLSCFKITNVKIHSLVKHYDVPELYIAAQKQKIHGGDFDVILSPLVFDCATEREDDFSCLKN